MAKAVDLTWELVVVAVEGVQRMGDMVMQVMAMAVEQTKVVVEATTRTGTKRIQRLETVMVVVGKEAEADLKVYLAYSHPEC
jgi:hypothetical protein